MITLSIFELKQSIIEAGEIAALGMIKIAFPAKDEVSYNEACRIAGDRRWVDYHVKQGNLAWHRRNGGKNAKRYFSRMEICALKKAEAIRDYSQLIKK